MKIRLYTLLLALFSLTSCKKEIKVALNEDAPSFDVTLASTNTYKAGEDVVFNFSGKADIISFFSGELYHEYAFKDGRILDMTAPTLAFTSAVTGGTQTNQLVILASTDFNGVYNDSLKAPLTDIHAATWVDITSRFVLGTTATFLASGAKSISDVVVAGKPLYLAFKYTTKPQAVNGAARTWMIQNFVLTGTASVGTLTLADMTNSGFRIVDGSPTTAPAKSTVAATRITLLGNSYDSTNDLLTENWAVSRAFNAGKIDAGPDYPVGIKGIANPTLTTYKYKYTKPGTYKVYFIASNANAYEMKQVIRSLDIAITP
jgi:hypothetical protein